MPSVVHAPVRAPAEDADPVPEGAGAAATVDAAAEGASAAVLEAAALETVAFETASVEAAGAGMVAVEKTGVGNGGRESTRTVPVEAGLDVAATEDTGAEDAGAEDAGAEEAPDAAGEDESAGAEELVELELPAVLSDCPLGQHFEPIIGL